MLGHRWPIPALRCANRALAPVNMQPVCVPGRQISCCNFCPDAMGTASSNSSGHILSRKRSEHVQGSSSQRNNVQGSLVWRLQYFVKTWVCLWQKMGHFNLRRKPLRTRDTYFFLLVQNMASPIVESSASPPITTPIMTAKPAKS